MRTVPTRYTIGQPFRKDATGTGYSADPYGRWYPVTLRYRGDAVTIMVQERMIDRMIVRRMVGTDTFCLIDVNPRRATVAAIVVSIGAMLHHDNPIDIGGDDNDPPCYDVSGDPLCDLFWQGEEWGRVCYPWRDEAAIDGRAWDLDDLTAARIVLRHVGEHYTG